MSRGAWVVVVAVLGWRCSAPGGQVLSQNVVGYEAVTMQPGGYAICRADFVRITNGSPVTVNDLIGSQLPGGSSLLLWDRAAQRYCAENRTRSGWTPGTNLLRRGEGFWLYASAAATSSVTVYLYGQVPSDASYSVSNVTGMCLLGYPYPLAMSWTNMNLAKNALANDQVYFWSVSSQAYSACVRTRSGWGSNASHVIQPGEGFWFSTAGTQTWTEVKPYTWP